MSNCPADAMLQDGKVYNKWVAYGQSKTANILFAAELSQRLGSKGLNLWASSTAKRMLAVFDWPYATHLLYTFPSCNISSAVRLDTG